jgi:hypothetical protein
MYSTDTTTADFPGEPHRFNVTAVRTREGLLITEAPSMPAKVFAMVGMESYFFPADEVGEVYDVPLPSDGRTVKVEVVSQTPRLVLVKDFLTPQECDEIISVSVISHLCTLHLSFMHLCVRSDL